MCAFILWLKRIYLRKGRVESAAAEVWGSKKLGWFRFTSFRLVYSNVRLHIIVKESVKGISESGECRGSPGQQ